MSATDAPAVAALRQRLGLVTEQGKVLESEGLPFPTPQIQQAFEEGLATSPDTAEQIVKRAEALIRRVRQDWTWVRELLRRADELRAIASTIGVDVAHLDARVGNARVRLSTEPLSSGSLQKAAASASLALAVLNDAVPKFCVQEAQKLAVSIRKARDRGEDVSEAAISFSRLIQSIQDQNLPTAAQRLVETRRSVARIPRAPAMPELSPQEEAEILLEARNLARRLQRIKAKARDASSAARLMTQVRAALSEDRRYGTPEEEIEALWLEVDRLTKEKKLASAGPPLASPVAPAVAPPELGADEEEAPTSPPGREPEGEEEPRRRITGRPTYVPYIPPESEDEEAPAPGADSSASGRARGRARPRP
ncbi:MAG TPA: hypothetical protein VEH57_08695 [Thermoplasmata archaeon]|nr:hypothetical protein [Thermoplasmata archaeon]